MHLARRRYPEAKVGDRFGPRQVTKLLPRGHKGRSDERVRWRCECGATGESFVFNLRTLLRGSTCRGHQG